MASSELISVASPSTAQAAAMAMRRVSPLERFSIARYELGLISNGAFSTAGRSDAPVIVGVGLRGPQLGDEALLRAVRIAVSQVVREHAALGARFVGPDEASLEWTRLPSIDLERAVTLGPVFASDGELEKFLSVEHGRAFETDKPLPLWRGVLVPRPDDILVLFSFHHGCMDGLAGIAFHISLLRALNNPPAEPIDLRAASTSEAPLPPSVESEVDVRPSLSLTAKVVLAGLVLPTRVSEAFGLLVRGFVGVKSDGPAWTRKTPTRAVTASLDPDVGHRLAMVCRSHGVSVTAIMTAALGAVIVEHFSGRGVTARVKADLAVALRSAFATPVGPDVITNSAGGVTAPQPRWSIEPHAVEVSLEEILFEARAVSAALKADTMRVEAAKASVGLLGLISGSVSDWLARKAASAEPTSTTYEVSNLGVVPVAPDEPKALWSASDDAVFSRYSGPIQSFIDLSSVSIRGRLRITLNYITPRCDDADARAVLGHLMRRLEEIAGPKASHGR